MKRTQYLTGAFLAVLALFSFGCGSGSTDTSGAGAEGFDNDTFSVSPINPGQQAAQGLPVIADPITTDNKLVVRCEPNATTTPVGAHVNAICKLSSPQASLDFTCLNGKVQGYVMSTNCARLTLNCNESGFNQESCDTNP